MLGAPRRSYTTFLVFGQAEEAVPPWHEHHAIVEIFALDLRFLEDDDVRLEDVEHGLDGEKWIA